jgi:hypothetical protein
VLTARIARASNENFPESFFASGMMLKTRLRKSAIARVI